MVSYDLLLFMLKIETTTVPRNKLYAIPRFPTGSFAVYVGDHLRFGIICGPIWGSFAVGDHLRRCTQLYIYLIPTLEAGSLQKNIKRRNFLA